MTFLQPRGVLAWWTDAAMAAAFLVTCEAEVIIHLHDDRAHDHWPSVVVVTIVVIIAAAIGARRRMPLLAVSVAMGGVVVLALSLSHLSDINSPQLVLFVAPYSVGAYSSRVRAIFGLALSSAAAVTLSVRSPSGASALLFTLGVCGSSWIAGRYLRGRRALAADLQQTTERIAAERDTREALAIADQRSRIAQELQALVAQSVSTMIVQSEAARRLLEHDLDGADPAMAMVEQTGRDALSQMRRILGVLRHPGEPTELSPQPGIGQIAALVEQARATRSDVTLQVEGTPVPLSASVDLAVYRILDETLEATTTAAPVDIRLRFAVEHVELTVTAAGDDPFDWPTIAIRERVSLCEGTIAVEALPDARRCLTVRLPRVPTGALA